MKASAVNYTDHKLSSYPAECNNVSNNECIMCQCMKCVKCLLIVLLVILIDDYKHT